MTEQLTVAFPMHEVSGSAAQEPWLAALAPSLPIPVPGLLWLFLFLSH